MMDLLKEIALCAFVLLRAVLEAWKIRMGKMSTSAMLKPEKFSAEDWADVITAVVDDVDLN